MSAIDLDALDRFFETYAQAWRRNNTPGLIAHWDAPHFAYYKAEEISQVFLSFDEVEAYFAQNESLHETVALQFLDVQPLAIAPDLWMIITPMRWDIRFAQDARTSDGLPFRHRGRAMGGDNHVLALIALTPKGLKLRGWGETPDAAITTMTQLYYRNVTPGF
jgi:hypothetical protein